MSSNSITRREVLQGGLAGAVALATVAGNAKAPDPGARQPNIVFILADDLGFADVGCYGRPELKTPNIDRIAATGTRLTQAYANSAVCSASRTALITGRYQYRFRIGLEEPLLGANLGLPPEQPTLPALLRKAGYGTTLLGKWHLGPLPNFGPLQSGYDHFYGFRSGTLDYFSHQNSRAKDDLWDDDVPVKQHGYFTELLGDRAVKVVKDYAAARRPFFLSLHFNAPHWPWEGPDDEAESKRIAGTPLYHRDGGTLKTYRKMIEVMDSQVGRVMRALGQSGISDNTIVIFTSDNGGERYSDTYPFTGKKTELLEGGLRVPAIISWPGRIAKGRVSDQVNITMDWVPTLLAAAGVEPDTADSLDGMDLLPYLTEALRPVSRKLYWRYKANHQRAMRDGDYKFLKILDNTFLFNVIDDPLEKANLKERRKDIYERMFADWRVWNRDMLPEVAESFTVGIDGKEQADHIGALPTPTTPDEMD